MRGRFDFCVSGGSQTTETESIVDCAGAVGKGNRLREAGSEARGTRRLGRGAGGSGKCLEARVYCQES